MTAVNKGRPTIRLQIGPFKKVLSLALEPNKPHEITLRDEVENLLNNPKSNVFQYTRNCEYTIQIYNAVFEEYEDLHSSHTIPDGAKLRLVKNDISDNLTASADFSNYQQKMNRAVFYSEVPGHSDKYVTFERKPAGQSEDHRQAITSPGSANYVDDGKSAFFEERPNAVSKILSSGSSNKQDPKNKTINVKTLLEFLESQSTSKTPLSAKEADVHKSTPIELRGNPGFLRNRDTEQIQRTNGDGRKRHKRREQSVDSNSGQPVTSDSSGDKELEKRGSSSSSSTKYSRSRDSNNKSIDYESSDERASSKRSRFSKRDDGEEKLRRLAQLESQRNSVWAGDSDPFLKEPPPQPTNVNKYYNWVKAGASVDEKAAPTSEEPPVKARKLDWKEQLIWEGQKLGFNENEALSTRAIYDGGLLLKSKNPVQMLYHFLDSRNKAKPEFVECWDGAEGYYQFYVCIGKQQCITSDRHSFDLQQAKVYAALKALYTLGRTKQQVKQTLEKLKQE